MTDSRQSYFPLLVAVDPEVADFFARAVERIRREPFADGAPAVRLAGALGFATALFDKAHPLTFKSDVPASSCWLLDTDAL